MDENPPVSVKKCPFCQQWSEWEQQPDDRCQHCGRLLDPRASHHARQEAAARQQPKAGIQLIQLRPEDKGLVWLLKWLARGGQLLFIAVVSFFVWLVTVLVA